MSALPRLTVETGPVAHGGHVVARHEGRVIFVRHALPGELVVVQITEGKATDGFWRGDAVEVLSPSPHRVPAPCPLARPDGCGGCDFQHAELSYQRDLKAAVVAEQLSRLAGMETDVTVEPVPGDQDGLRWRTRMQYSLTSDGRRGLRKHRSHEVVPVEDCLIAAVGAREVVVDERRRAEHEVEIVDETVRDRSFRVAADGFWQVHPGAPEALLEAILGYADVQPGEAVLDLFAGVGLFSAFLARQAGPEGSVLSVEGDRRAAALAAENLADLAQVKTVRAEVARIVTGLKGPRPDVVVLDPPRAGAKRRVVEALAALDPRAVVYVACDPAALARDVAIFAEGGYALQSLRAFDLFPMTHHVECVALLTPTR